MPDRDVEVEVKARVDDLGRIRQSLEDRGAQRLGSARQADTYFDHPERSFADTDEALRVREIDGDATLTYKGPKLDETTKTREEIDLGVADREDARSILEALDFTPSGTVVKERESYQLGALTVTLDRVEGLGGFVEIEQVVQDDVDEARQAILDLADELGLEDRERRSYLELLIEGQGDGAA